MHQGPLAEQGQYVVNGVSLRDLAMKPGPFLTYYLGQGSGHKDHLSRFLSAHTDMARDAVDAAVRACPDEVLEGSVCVVSSSSCSGQVFALSEPMSVDVIRFGTVPSFGLLLQSIQTPSPRDEAITEELGRFAAAREQGMAAEESDVIQAVRSGLATSVLVHDDPADNRLLGQDRMVDLVTSSALLHGLPLTIIPSVASDRGPLGGVGAILRPDALVRQLNPKIIEAVSAATYRIDRAPQYSQRAKGA